MRSMGKAIQEYRKRIRNNGEASDFYFSDVQQIKELSTHNGNVNIYDLIFNALQAGYAVGYRTAERHCKQRMERK